MEKFYFSIQVLVIGFMVVMVTLFALYAILLLFNRLFNKPEQKKDEGKSALAETLPTTEGKADDRRIIAAVIAAVYQYMDSSGIYRHGPLKIAVQEAGSYSGKSWHIVGRKKLLESGYELEKIRRKKNREKF